MEKDTRYYSLTHPQKAVWFNEKLHPDTSISNIAATLKINDSVDFTLLEKAIHIIIEKNDALRLRFIEQDGVPKQYISEYTYKKLDFFDFSDKGLEALYEWDAQKTNIPFRLIDSDLFYFALIKIDHNTGGVYASIHHLISDAWSVSQLGNQIIGVYSKLKGEEATAAVSNPSFIDYIASEQDYLDSERCRKDKEYWHSRFELFPGITKIKNYSPESVSIKAKRKTMLLPKKLTTKIYDYCAENKTSVFSIFTAALSMYINRITSKENITFGTTTLNRLNSKEKATTGMFNNIAPMIIHLKDHMNFRELIELVTREGLSLLKHQRYPYDLILKKVRETHKVSDNIFDILLTYHNIKFVKDENLVDYKTRWHFNGYQVDSLHIYINDRENEGHLIIDYDYLVDLFHAKEIDFIHQNLINILWHALDNPAKAVSRLEMLSEKEKHKILYEFNKTKIIYPEGTERYFDEPGKELPKEARCYILDKNGNILPIGIAGQLYISGAHLKAEKMKALGISKDMAVSNPYFPEDVLYALNCSARWYPDGDILYLGRNPSEKSGEERVNILSTFTAEPVEDYIKWWGREFGYHADIHFAGYNQVFQELLDPSGMLSENKDGINVLMVRFEDFIRYNKETVQDRLSLLDRTYEDLKEAVRKFAGGAPLIITVFPVSTHLRFPDNIKQMLVKINTDFVEVISNQKNAYLLDFRELQISYGIPEAFDIIKDKEGHMPFTEEYYAAMGTELARKIIAIKKQVFKVIVLDCDNTLWKGICGEDGVLGVQVAEPYKRLQQFMLQKHKEGMLLAVCSKNNEKDVFDVFEHNPEMILDKSHITSWKVNWREKSENIKEIAEELNLGTDSFIFMDDDSLECSKMVERRPEVLTLQLPEKDEYIPLFLKHLWAFDRVKATKEDLLRSSMYEAEKKRKEMKDKDISLESFLAGLQLKVSMRPAAEDEIGRAAQMTQRTNQFNLSTIRRSEDEMARLLSDERYRCFVAEASDKFGDYGIIGLVILRDDGDKLFLDTLLMSCRIFGRNVEDALLAGIGRYARESDGRNIEAVFIPTEKNLPVCDFIKRVKWTLIEETEKGRRFCFNAEELPCKAGHIDFYYNEMYKVENEDHHRTAGYLLKDMEKDMERCPVKPVNDSDFALDNAVFYNEVIGKTNRKEYIEPLRYVTGKELHRIISGGDTCFNTCEYGKDGNDIQEKLIAIWRSILKTNDIKAEDDFFKLGGDSLSAVVLISRIKKEFSVELTLKDIFKYSTTVKQTEKIAGSNKIQYVKIAPVEKKDYYPLSSAQKRMYILNRIEQDSTGYNECHKILIEGRLDRHKLEDAFQRFTDRHEITRTGFEMLDEGPVQRVYDHIGFKMPFMKVKPEEADHLAAGFVKPFDLAKPPLFRVSLLETDIDKHILLLDIHHIIIDGASFGIMIKEVLALYEGREPDRQEIQYKDFANWQNTFLKSPDMKKQEDYWLQQFSGEIPVLNLPADHQRPVVQSFSGKKVYFALGRSEAEKLKSICNETATTLFMLLFAAFNVLLYRYTGQEDIVIGAPVSGRRNDEIKNVVGIFVNTLPIRTRPEADSKFAAYLGKVKDAVLKGLENQDYQYDYLVEKLDVQRQLNRNPLFDVLFSLQNKDMPDIKPEGMTVSHSRIDNQKSKFDISLLAVEKGDALEFELEYCTDLFEEDTIERLREHFLNVLREISRDPAQLISDIEMMSEREKRRILYEFNDTQTEYPKDKMIHQLFEEQAERTPDSIAVVFEDKKLTYAELNAKANQLARVIRARGVENNCVVGIMLERSIDLVIGILGIVKSGGAYLPIDISYPKERIKYILEVSGTKTLITTENLICDMELSQNKIFINDANICRGAASNLVNNNLPNDLLYVVFTSGTTGKPKGVMIEHKNLINLIMHQLAKNDVNYKSNILQFASMNFDVYSQELFSALLAGGTLHILSGEDKKNVMSMFDFVYKHNINIMYLPTAFFKYVINNVPYSNFAPECVKHIIVAGEKLTLTRKFTQYLKQSGVRLHNHYGPAETHVVTTYTINNEGDFLEAPPIGKPISNTQIHILSKDLNVQPEGIYGEIYIAGESVGRGYIGNELLTSERFVTINILNEHIRAYKTGDIGKWSKDGDIEFLGRADNQVKIRGYRVELEEIETYILKHEKIKECAVLLQKLPDGRKELAVYYTALDSIITNDLKKFLKEFLPVYMIPKYFIQISDMPLNQNGKINKDILQTYFVSGSRTDIIDKPTNSAEKKLVDIWRNVLGTEEIGISDNFFNVGGDSLLTIKVVLEASKKGFDFSIRDLYNYPTVKELVENVSGYIYGEVK